jgi:hypothetical protein
MDNEHDPCLAASEILSYVDGELAEGRKTEIDRHLDECRLCGAAVEGVAGREWREGFLKSTERVQARVRARTGAAVRATAGARRPAPRFRPAPQYLTLAASLVLGLGAAVYLTRSAPGEALFQRYFEPYPNTRPIVRGGSAAGRSNALALYEAGDYRGALAALEGSLEREPGNSEARFYAGLSRLALGQAAEAALDLEQVAPGGESELRAPAEWYLALAHLRSQDPAETWYLALARQRRPDLAAARSHLERIAGAGGFYQSRARELLSELDRLDRSH